MLKEFIKEFANEEIVKDFVKIDRSYFSINEKIKQIISSIKTKPEFAGIPLGREKGNIFAPSLYLLQKLAEVSNKKIRVDKKGEWMFICGKDIFGKSIAQFCDVKIGELILVQNLHSECLGYGKIIADLHQKGVVIENIFDIGDFLRRQR